MSANPAPGFRNRPDYRITTESLGQAVTVSIAGHVVAHSDNALLLKEGSYPPVVYVPFSDVDFNRLERSATSSHCPFKGDASYWSAIADDSRVEDVMWAYEQPYDEMAAIKDCAAFYSSKAEIAIG